MMCDLGGFATEGSGSGGDAGVAAAPVRVRGTVTSVTLRSIPSLRGSSHGVWLGSWWLMWG